MLKTSRILGLLIGASLLSGCVTPPPQPKFYWGAYEHSLYVYSKKPDQREYYRTELQKAVDQGRVNNSMAPGLLAELGYLYLEDGDTTKAVALFQEEMTHFPESRVFLTTVVERAKANAGQTAAKKGQ